MHQRKEKATDKFSNKGQNPTAGIKLKTCFLLYYKVKTYKVLNYFLFYKPDYVFFFFFLFFRFFLIYIYISITMYLLPVIYLERVISSAFTMKTGTREK